MTVFAAASLARALADLEERFERSEPAFDLRLEFSGSQDACRKIAELQRRADVVATADYRVIDSILRPEHAAFTLRFATNEVVLAHQQHSRFTEQITTANWITILLRPGVRLGMAAPDQAPIGYATLLVWTLAGLQQGGDGASLAGRLRTRCAREHVVSDEQDLLALLQSRAIDYAFVYRSTAEEHNLKTVLLPDAYNLGAAERAREYARARVRLRLRSGEAPREIRGAPIIYGATIPSRANNRAGGLRFLRLLLGENGRRTLRRTGFRPLAPARAGQHEAVPPELHALVRPSP